MLIQINENSATVTPFGSLAQVHNVDAVVCGGKQGRDDHSESAV
jgi:hypothetical protein